MKQIAVLGPKGTYSDIACQKYINENNLDLEILYYPSILKVSNAIDDNTIFSESILKTNVMLSTL